LTGSSLPAQGVRFATSGVAVGLFYLLVTTILADVFGVDFQVALALGFASALTLHFVLQRVFVWAHHGDYALETPQQVPRYLAVALLQYALTSAATRFLPDALGVSVTLVYLVTAVTLSVISFFVFRSRVFHPKAELAPQLKETRGS
jgi:putative flippase GtrA